jgi:hypothetical protein
MYEWNLPQLRLYGQRLTQRKSPLVIRIGGSFVNTPSWPATPHRLRYEKAQIILLLWQVFPEGRYENSPGWSVAQPWERIPILVPRPGGPHRSVSFAIQHAHEIPRSISISRFHAGLPQCAKIKCFCAYRGSAPPAAQFRRTAVHYSLSTERYELRTQN